MNISIGPPYEAAIKRIIGRGYSGNQTEVIRQGGQLVITGCQID